MIDKIYPVGSIYLSVNNVSPATFIGGTWSALSNGYILKLITSGTGGAENAASNTGKNNGNTGGPSTTNTSGPSTTNTGPSSGSTGGPSTTNTGEASGDTGGHKLTAAQSGVPAHSHKFSSNGVRLLAAANAGTEHGIEGNYGAGTNGFWSFSTTTENNSAADASSEHKHSLNKHTHTLNSHTHSLKDHVHSLNSHTHTLNSHTHSLNSHDHTPGMPANISVYGWKRTA